MTLRIENQKPQLETLLKHEANFKHNICFLREMGWRSFPFGAWCARFAITFAGFCMAAMAQQIPSFPGIVKKVGGKGLSHVTVRIEGAGSAETSDSGEFTFPLSDKLRVGFPAIFQVTNWVIVKPCGLKNGRTYLRDPGVEQIEILVLPPSDPRLKSVAATGSIIGCLIQEVTARAKIPIRGY